MKREFILTPEREDFIQTESNEVHFNCRGAAFLMQRYSFFETTIEMVAN